MTDTPLDPIAIDVGEVLQRTMTSLYAHLVTRPTGRAVRMAIETRLEGAGERSVSLIDFSEVVIIDFSCADEVVAKLLQRFRDDAARDAFFVFVGVSEPHRDQVETVLERQGLAAVVGDGAGAFELIGVHSDVEAKAWSLLQSRGMITDDEAESVFGPDGVIGLTSLTDRGLAYRGPASGRVHALTRLVEHML